MYKRQSLNIEFESAADAENMVASAYPVNAFTGINVDLQTLKETDLEQGYAATAYIAEAADGSRTDELTGIEGVLGTGFEDILQGGSDENIIYAGDGDDVVIGNGGDDDHVLVEDGGAECCLSPASCDCQAQGLRCLQ